jgi:hypothetical protein
LLEAGSLLCTSGKIFGGKKFVALVPWAAMGLRRMFSSSLILGTPL